MIVRLKEELIVQTSISPTKFQFYDSPIKSIILYCIYFIFFVFQFYDSPIKRKL